MITRTIIKIVGYAMLGLLALPVMLLIGLYGWAWVDDVRYARDFFKGRVEIVRVIASKRWLDFGERGLGCSYAAVEFSEETADRLRAGGPEALAGSDRIKFPWYIWNVPWQRTPATGVSDHVLAPFSCLRHFPKRDADLIKQSLLEPGSWYYEGREIGAFLSAEHRLAVSLRNGD